MFIFVEVTFQRILGHSLNECGAIAQLGERFAGSEEVCGSIPHSSTNINIVLFN
jgi:hypothetical protein